MSILYIWFLIIFYFLIEKTFLYRRRNKIKCIILITGIRGKTTLAKKLGNYIGKLNKRCLVKTTGTKPEIIINNKTVTYHRRSPVNIIEQRRIMNLAVKNNIEYLVIESMAITPETMRTESEILKPDYTVFTNVLEDHQETLGNTRDEIAVHFENYFNKSKAVILFKDDFKNYFRHIDNNFITVPRSRTINDNDLLLKQLVLVCFNKRYVSGSGKVQPVVKSLQLDDLKIYLYDLFDCNDADSAAVMIKKIKNSIIDLIILNTREDRPFRTVNFIQLLKKIKLNYKNIIITGNGYLFLKRLIQRQGVKARILARKRIRTFILERFRNKRKIYILGLGNIKNREQIFRYV